jgi:hypothetical protein
VLYVLDAIVEEGFKKLIQYVLSDALGVLQRAELHLHVADEALSQHLLHDGGKLHQGLQH